MNREQKNDPYWTYSSELVEDLVAEGRGLTPDQWRKEPEEDRALMIATYRAKRKMKNWEHYYFSKD